MIGIDAINSVNTAIMKSCSQLMILLLSGEERVNGLKCFSFVYSPCICSVSLQNARACE